AQSLNNVVLTMSGASGNIVSGSSVTTSGSFFGDGLNLTNLNATNLAAGTVNDARLPATMSAKTFSGLITANAGVTLAANQALNLSGASGNIVSASSITTTGSFFGDGSHLTGVVSSPSGSAGGGPAGPPPHPHPN